jgi:hydrogenase-4 membrane subunit HyfE
MSPLVGALLGLFVLYFVVVTWLMRRAVRAPPGAARLREARLLLLVVSAGIPLAVVLIVAA